MVLRSAPRANLAAEWALVLEASGLPYRVDAVGSEHQLVTLSPYAVQARRLLEQYERENASEPADLEPADPAPLTVAWLGPVWAALLMAVYGFTGPVGPGSPLFEKAANSAREVMAGQLWRLVTALSLHADPVHLLGNCAAAIFFGGWAARRLGGGTAAAVIFAAGTIGNGLTALFYRTGHISFGASTAVFGALGALAGLQLAPGRGTTAGSGGGVWQILGASLALFGLLGTGEQADQAAHLLGLTAGILLGWGTGALSRRRASTFHQALLGLAVVAVQILAWIKALG